MITGPLAILLLVAGAFLVAWLVTGLVRRLALNRGMLDVPNARSSHSIPTPRGGGLGIVLATVGVLACMGLSGTGPVSQWVALAGGLPVAAIGWRDDVRPVSPLLRMLVHIFAGSWALWWLGGLPPLQVGQGLVGFGPLAPVIGVIGVIWVLNLFNFMDGIDGIAGMEAVFIAVSGGLLLILEPSAPALSLVCLAFGAASAGFLAWNWAPARIFMGDVGSGFVGFVIAVLAIAAAATYPAALFTWLILGGVFFVDATVTLIRRLARGERAHMAHRSHVYQRLARAWGSHAKVTLAALAINLGWLLPWAIATRLWPAGAGWFAIAALLPLVVLSIMLGAGRREPADT